MLRKSLLGLMLCTAAVAGHAQSATPPLYTVVDGYKVDAETMKGFRAWRAAACDRCHGANQEGMVGPSLIDGMKRLSQDEFKATVLNGRLEKGMPSFGGNPGVVAQIDALCQALLALYGAVQAGHLSLGERFFDEAEAAHEALIGMLDQVAAALEVTPQLERVAALQRQA